MSKLGIKIIVSYIIMALISTLIFLILIRGSLIGIVIQEKKNNLLKISKSISHNINVIMSESGIDTKNIDSLQIGKKNKYNYYIKFGNKSIEIPNTVFYDKSDSFNVYFLDNDDKIIYIFYNNSSEKTTTFIGSKYFIDKQDLSINGNRLGSILISTEVNDWNDINTKIYSSVYSGFLITMLIALILALIFEISIVGPISKLRLNIGNISMEKQVKWNDVHTSDELEDINRELYVITNKLRDYNQTQKEFFQNTSHELKTPLMSIRGYAEAIKDGILDEEDIENSLDIIIEESTKLSEMITSIIYIGSIERHKVSTEKKVELINIYNEIEKLKETLAYADLEKHIEIVNNIPSTLSVESDPEKVNRVLSNLFSNAIRYANTMVKFDFYEKDGVLHFFVSDDGKGFEDGENTKIFDRFYKGDGGKSGLGLAIVSSIVKTSKGGIRAYNSKEGGAVIEIAFYKSDSIYY